MHEEIAMPLKKGRSDQVIGQNIEELLDKFKSSGSIGKTSPSSMKKARSIAAAIAFKQAGRGRRK